MKKLLLIGLLLLTLSAALFACDGADPSVPPAEDTSQTDSTTSESYTDVTAEPPSEETDAVTPEEETTVPEEPSQTSEESDTLPDGDAEETSALPPSDEDTSHEETQPEDTQPEETGPGQLVFVSNDELRYLDNNGAEIGCAYEAGAYESWTSRTVTVGRDQVALIVDEGWAAFDSWSYEFGYVINGEHFFSETYAREADAFVVDAATQKGASNCARFCGYLTAEVLKLGANTVQFCVRLDGDVVAVLREYTVNLSQNPVRLDGSFWQVEMELWEVSGHKKGITPATDPTHGGMVKAGGVDKGALLHQGAIGIGTVDLSKYEKIIVYYGCDASATTQGYYNANAHNRIMVTKVDTNGKNSPDAKDIIAYADYALYGWTPHAVEIDLTGINYKGPVYITIDTLPGTFVLVTSIELIGAGKPDTAGKPETPVEKDYAPPMSEWEVSGHKKGVTPASDPTHGGMVAAGGVSEGALLHQGSVGVGTVDLSKYSKVIVYYGCDASGVTQNHYNESAHNRIMLSAADTDGKNSPDAKDIIAYADYALYGWTPYALEIDLTGVTYNGPVYITVDTLPGTFMLITAIEFVV